MFKKIILILALICMIALPVFGQTGNYTTHSLFYLPKYGAYGITEYNTYNAYMEIADAQIWANKLAFDNFKTSDINDVDLTDIANNKILKYNSTSEKWECEDESGGVTTFLGLTDTPANYTGQAGKYTKVNAGETALEFGTIDLSLYYLKTEIDTFKLSAFAATTSAELAGVISDETGTGLLVFGTSPTITTPIITQIVPGADFTLSQNSVLPFTSVETGAVVDTLYLKAGQVGIGQPTPLSALHIRTKDLGVATDDYSESSVGYLTVEAEDARLILFSEDEGGHGSTISLAEITAGVYQAQWSFTKMASSYETFGNELHINYGTDPGYANNDEVLVLRPTGEVVSDKFYSEANDGAMGHLSGGIAVQAEATGGADTFILTVVATGGEVIALDMDLVGDFLNHGEPVYKKFYSVCGIGLGAAYGAEITEQVAIGDALKTAITAGTPTAVVGEYHFTITFTNTDDSEFNGILRIVGLLQSGYGIIYSVANNQ